MKRILVFILLPTLLFGGCTIPFLQSKKAGIKVMSTPQAMVMLDGKQVGQTPLQQSALEAKTYKLQLIPQSGQQWETTVTLRNNLQVVAERIFGPTDQESEGYTMELEQIGDKSQSQISIVTIPDPATVRIDSQPKGFSPMTVTLLTDGNHEVAIFSAGYTEKKIPVSVPKGYKLSLTVQLARQRLVQPTPEASDSAQPAEEPTPTPGKGKVTPAPTPKTAKPTPTKSPTASSSATVRPYVEILTTPTGWLKVRSEPSTAKGEETVIAKVNPGETYKFIEANSSGWYNIQLTAEQDGWVSGQYAKLYR